MPEHSSNQTALAPALLVMAAGIGSRYGGLKQLDPVGPGGEVIIDYSIYDAIRAGFGKVVFIIRREIEEAFRESISRKFEGRIPVEHVFQELDCLPTGFAVPPGRKKPWGTGHAILMAEEKVQGPFAVINADDFYGAQAFQIQSRFLSNARDGSVAHYSMVGYVLRNTLSEFGSVSRAICECDADGYLEGIIERTKVQKEGREAKYLDDDGETRRLSGDELVSMNMWGFTPSIFHHLQKGFLRFLEEQGFEEKAEFFMTVVIDALVAEGRARLKVLPTDSRWFGVTHPEDKPHVVQSIRNLIAEGVYPEKLWADS